MTHTFICPGCEQAQPHAAALALHAAACDAYATFMSSVIVLGPCPDCGRLLEDAGLDWCSRNGEYLCPSCHHESGCRCTG